MRPKLKVNNLTNLQDARYSAALGFDFVSFSLERGSTKKLPPNLIWNMVNWLEGPEVVLELNTYSLEELESVDKAFSYRYITMPLEEWSDLILQTSSSIILRANETSSEADMLRIREEMNARDCEIIFELNLSSLVNLNKYSQILPHAFVSFTHFADTLQLIKDQKFFPYGVSIGEEAEEDGLLDYEQIDQFVELLDGLYEHS